MKGLFITASGRGARVLACAGLINELQNCSHEHGIAIVKCSHSNCNPIKNLKNFSVGFWYIKAEIRFLGRFHHE